LAQLSANQRNSLKPGGNRKRFILHCLLDHACRDPDLLDQAETDDRERRDDRNRQHQRHHQRRKRPPVPHPRIETLKQSPG